jgi:flagellar brake protein
MNVIKAHWGTAAKSPAPVASAAQTTPPASANIRNGAAEPAFVNEESPDVAPFVMRERREVLAVLQRVLEQRANVTVYFRNGHEHLFTRIIGLNPRFEELIFDTGPDAAANARLAACNSVVFVTQDETVKVQFSAGHPESVMMDELPAFRVRVPETLVRLQRRNHFRIAMPIVHPVLMQIPDPSGLSGFSGRVSAKVLDLSCGGASILVPDNRLDAQAGDEFADCILDLGDHGLVRANLEVRHACEEKANGRVRGVRLRCRFRTLGEHGEITIQRYIHRLEAERRDRL